jgi:flagellar basal-body rod modification protein FlgD
MSTIVDTNPARFAGNAPTLGQTVITDPSGASMSQRTPVKTLGQDEFFKLIAAQFSYQDPLNPQKDTDFIAQMAQFNTLEQTRAMQSDIEGLRSQFTESQASLLLGQVVNIKDPISGNNIQGLVTEVRPNAGRAMVVVNGTAYDSSAVQSLQILTETPTQTTVSLPHPEDPLVVGPVYRP